jgi:hypothetical protein
VSRVGLNTLGKEILFWREGRISETVWRTYEVSKKYKIPCNILQTKLSISLPAKEVAILKRGTSFNLISE